MQTEALALLISLAVVYVTLNIVGTVYYMKVNQVQNISFSENAWALSSVILGWLVFPLFNLSSPISYAVHR